MCKYLQNIIQQGAHSGLPQFLSKTIIIEIDKHIPAERLPTKQDITPYTKPTCHPAYYDKEVQKVRVKIYMYRERDK